MTIQNLIADLKTVPDEVYRQFCNQSKIVAMMYPSAHGIDCFARGETIEDGFVDTIGHYIDLKPNKKEEFNDPDAVYGSQHLTDVKTQGNGFIPQKSGKKLFYSKQWDIKKTASGSTKFESKADSYILIDPLCARIAVIDTQVFYNKKFTPGAARISFPIKPEDVTMIYDGIDDVIHPNIVPDPRAIYRTIWEEAGGKL